MSAEKLSAVLKALPKGCYAHPLAAFINGELSITRRKTIKVPVEIPVSPLESPFKDVRAVMSPLNNKLVPMLIFIDPNEFSSSQSTVAEG